MSKKAQASFEDVVPTDDLSPEAHDPNVDVTLAPDGIGGLFDDDAEDQFQGSDLQDDEEEPPAKQEEDFSSDIDDDIDISKGFDSEVKAAKKKEGEDLGEEHELVAEMLEAEGSERETIAQQHVKTLGRELKLLKPKLTELEAANEALQKEVESLKGGQRVSRQELLSHPEVSPMLDNLSNEVSALEIVIGDENAQKLYANLRTHVAAFKNIPSDPAERKTYIQELKDGFDEEYGYDNTKEVMSFLAKNSNVVQKIDDTLEKLERKSEEGVLSIGVKDYEERFKDTVQGLVEEYDVPEEVLANTPFDAKSIVAEMRKNPNAEAFFKKALNVIGIALHGAKPPTQEEIEAVERKGGNIKDFHKQKKASASVVKKQVASMALFGAMVQSQAPQWYKEFQKSKSIQSETSALSNIRGAKASPSSSATRGGLDSIFG
jgi:hypothetical protein